MGETMTEARAFTKKELKNLPAGSVLTDKYDNFFVTPSGIFSGNGGVYSRGEFARTGYQVRVVFTPES